MRKLVLIFLLLKTPAFAQINADFSASVISGCTPLVVQFKDQSTGNVTSWFWDFGNGTTSSLQNPTVTYTVNGSYTVRLIIKSASGKDYEQKNNYITVYTSPKAGFFVSVGDSGCVSLLSSFTDTSLAFNTSMKTWLWDFGDGNSSNQQNASHVYNTAGEYNVSLTVTTAQGCSSTQTKNNAVIAGNKPVASFSASPLNGCASTFRDFKNKSSGNITGSLWSFGDGGLSLDKNPEYHYRDTGKFTVKLIVSENGCKDSTRIVDYIHVSGPVAKFSGSLNCTDKSTVTFRDNSIDAATRLWNFDDGQTSTQKNPIHVYNNPGMYVITLVETGTACSDTALDTIYIKTSFPKVKVSPLKSFYCKYDSIQFLITGYETAIAKSVTWDFGDGFIRAYKGVADTVEHVYTQNGHFAPVIYLKDKQSCTDTAQLSPAVFIKGPTAQFQNAANGCTNSPFIFQDQSIANNGVAINNWFWSFGDGSTSTAQNPAGYNYAFPVEYTVNLKVTDADKCSDTVTHVINISSSPTIDAVSDTFACAGNSVQLTASGATSFTWQNNGDLSCTQCADPVAKPTQSATYYVTGTTNGCSSIDSVKLKVQTKENLIVQQSAFTICKGGFVVLNVKGTDKFSWLFDSTLSSTTIPNPIARPITNTTYTAVGKDRNNCFNDTARVTISLSPSPDINIADSVADVIAGSTYTINATTNDNTVTLLWLPLSGLSCYNCLNPTTTVNSTVTYTLTGSNEFGCSDSDAITLVALCDDKSLFIPNTFSPNNDGTNDYFFPRANGSLLVRSMIIYNRWGQLLYQKRNFYTNGYNDGWDGRYKNVLQKPDVYVYLMELQCTGDKTYIKRGTITLIQ